MGTLAGRGHLSKQTMTQVVRRLEADGLVERQGDPDDARASRVYLTDRSRAFESVAAAILRRLDERVRKRLGAARARDVKAALAELLTVGLTDEAHSPRDAAGARRRLAAWVTRPIARQVRLAELVRGAVARHRPRLRPADGARAAPVPDRAAAGRAVGLDEDDARRRLLHGAAGQRRLPHRRARAGQVVRRRHRAEVDQVRLRTPFSVGRTAGHAAAARRRAARRCTGSASGSSSPSPATARSTG